MTIKILQNIQDNPSITIGKLSEILGLTEEGIRWNMRNLQRKEIIRRVGSNRKGYWEIISNDRI
jgi:ATP-dependent DNA helicase RecG